MRYAVKLYLKRPGWPARKPGRIPAHDLIREVEAEGNDELVARARAIATLTEEEQARVFRAELLVLVTLGAAHTGGVLGGADNFRYSTLNNIPPYLTQESTLAMQAVIAGMRAKGTP